GRRGHARSGRSGGSGGRARGRGLRRPHATHRQPHAGVRAGVFGRSAMKRTMCKSKIHRATVTDADLDYEGSITVDPELLEAADILPYEQVHVVNVNNGARFETYAIQGDRGTGQVIVNGAAA